MLMESGVSHFGVKCQQIQLKVMEFKVSMSGSYGDEKILDNGVQGIEMSSGDIVVQGIENED